jgi:hypothetical protein
MRIRIACVVGVCAVVTSATAQPSWGAVPAPQPDTIIADSTAKRLQQTIDSLSAVLRAIQARLDSIAAAAATAPITATSSAIQPRAPGTYMNVSFVGLTDFGWASTRNVRALEVGDHDPRVRGFTIPNAELALDGNVDPYVKGFANVVYKLDENGETGVELEEMYFLTTSLPWNLQLKGGQYFVEFGRQNPQHPHSWAFADQPLVLNRMFGGEGLRSQGVRVSWLAPTSWYTEVMLGVFNSAGETAFSFRSEESSEIHGGEPFERSVDHVSDMLYVPRIATSFDVTDNQTIVVGASAAFGPNNAGAATDTRIFGGDLYYKWKSPTAQKGFPFVSLQAEVLARHYETDARPWIDDPSQIAPGETLKDNGMYAQILWGIKPLLVAGLRGEYANGRDAGIDAVSRQDRTRWSPNLTWFPTEFSKFRVQYNYDHRPRLNDHSVWFQFEYLLGAHAAHKF